MDQEQEIREFVPGAEYEINGRAYRVVSGAPDLPGMLWPLAWAIPVQERDGDAQVYLINAEGAWEYHADGTRCLPQTRVLGGEYDYHSRQRWETVPCGHPSHRR